MEIKFNYIAAGKDGSRQNGAITAENESEARAKLHSMGFSVLKLTEDGSTNIKHKAVEKRQDKDNSSSLPAKNSKIYYDFSGIKHTGEILNGTIESKNEIAALKWLYEKYNLNVTWIVERDLSPAIKEHKKKGSVDRILAEAFDEGILIKKPGDKDENADDKEFDISKEERDALEEDVKKYVSGIKFLLKNCNGIITGVDLSDISKLVAELEKIQKSNNLLLIQSELEDLLKKVDSFFNEKNKEDLPDETLEVLNDISRYIGTGGKDFFEEKVLPFLEKFSFLKKYLEKVQKYIESHKNPELDQKKENLKRYLRRFFYHLKLFITSSSKEERSKRLNALKKTFGLIFSTYKTYSSVKKKINENRHKYYLEFRRGNRRLYDEIRFISSLVLCYYFFYFIFIDFGLRKGIFVNYELGYFTISSGFIITLLFGAFLLNFLSLIKIKFFLKNMYFDIVSLFFLIFLILFYYVNY